MKRICIFLILCFSAACAPQGDQYNAEGKLKNNSKADEWGTHDDPHLFTQDLEMELAKLPENGEAVNIPWASSYWPVYKDSVNDRWEGEETLSPAEKYGKAFGIEDIMDKVSAHHGIDSQKSRTACTKNDDCNSKIGERCSKRVGQDDGFCIPTWWGICHAWAPVSILEPEAVHPVTRNGVTFKVNDIKALMTLAYNRSTSRFVSLRCNEDDSQDEIEYDAYDRPTGDDLECKDTNPGTLHVLLANYLGIKGQSFVEDRTFDDEVWNQPLRSFEVKEQKEVTAQEANEIVGVPAVSLFVNEFEGRLEENDWHHEDAYDVESGWKIKVVMSGTGNGDLYVRFGSPPTSEDHDCAQTSDDSEETCTLTTPEGASKLYVSVKGIADDSKFMVTSNLGNEMGEIPTHYLFNDKAVTFYHMKTKVKYIAESDSDTDGNLGDKIDTYTRTDNYQYILELDGDGEIIGGEWVGYSKKSHPDFLWLPTGRRAHQDLAGGAIEYDRIKELLDMSLAGENDEEETTEGGGEETSEIPPEGGSVELVREASVEASAWKHFGPFEATDGAIVVEMTGQDGDADLYIRKGDAPSKDDYDCRPYKSGSNETCNLLGPAKFYIGVWGTKKSDVALSIKFNAPAQEGFEPAPIDAEEGGEMTVKETGSLSMDEWKQFGPYVHTEGSFEAVITGTGDADLYVKKGSAPSASNYDCRPYEEGSAEACKLEGAGSYYVGVLGYKDATFELAISYFTGPAGSNTDTGETTDGMMHLDLNSHVNKGEMKYYQISVKAGERVEVATQASGDVDLYVKMNMLPTEDVYDARGFTYTGNEKVTYLPTADGTMHIGVFGFEESDFNLKTSSGE